MALILVSSARAKYPEDCFHHPSDSGCFPHYPVDPDNDANEPD